MNKGLRFMRWMNLFVISLIAFYFLFVPGVLTIRYLIDPKIRTDEIPSMAWDLFENLAPQYAQWAHNRINTQRPTQLSLSDISGTEWPLFGSVFFLWGIESLQEAWEKDHTLFKSEPRQYAADAIRAATELVWDPQHAAWVKKHWGANYLQTENAFYRVLLIASATSFIKLTGDTQYLLRLQEQVRTFAKEIDQSPYGLLDDYPGECYPTDIMLGIDAIRRADSVLETDHSAFIARSIRGFEGPRLDRRGLPPYDADSKSGFGYDPSRGCGISYALMSSPYLWPERARKWFALYEGYFWQNKYGLPGFREFPNDVKGHDWFLDVDAGPVLAGIGVSATAFGVAASRINGRFDLAYPLTAEMVVSSWPLWNGTLLIPRYLSNAADAPLLGEACILYNLTRRAAPGFEMKTGGQIPGFAYAGTSLYFLLAFLFIFSAYKPLTRPRETAMFPSLQLAVWTILLIAGVALIPLMGLKYGVAAFLAAQLLPRKA
jgi:hypothetical protein